MRMSAVLIALLLLSTSAVIAGDSFTLTVTNIVSVAQSREATVVLGVPAEISLTKDATLGVLMGTDKRPTKPDEFGPPQVFALKGSNRQINPHEFRVIVVLPREKVTVRLLLRDRMQVLADEKREL